MTWVLRFHFLYLSTLNWLVRWLWGSRQYLTQSRWTRWLLGGKNNGNQLIFLNYRQTVGVLNKSPISCLGGKDSASFILVRLAVKDSATESWSYRQYWGKIADGEILTSIFCRFGFLLCLWTTLMYFILWNSDQNVPMAVPLSHVGGYCRQSCQFSLAMAASGSFKPYDAPRQYEMKL